MSLRDLRGPRHWIEWTAFFLSSLIFSLLGWIYAGWIGAIFFSIVGCAAFLYMLN